MKINDIIKQSQNGEPFSKEQLIEMLNLAPDSPESYQVMAEANRISKELTNNKAEVHAQFALNLSPCPMNCKFCSFASINGVFNKAIKICTEDAVRQAKEFENQGANAIFIMTTGDYDLGEFVEISQEVRKNMKPETVLIANVGDKDLNEAKEIKYAGYQGVYHAVRLREGRDTNISPERRKKSIEAFKEAGLAVGTCVEPIGPEHTNEEIAEMILLTNSFNPAYSGAGRRISVLGSELAQYGMISELRMAQIVALTRLGMSRTVKGNCTHEPCTLGALAGVNLFWAESGANPRDSKEKTEEGRGKTVAECQTLFLESGWEILKKQSVYYTRQYMKINQPGLSSMDSRNLS